MTNRDLLTRVQNSVAVLADGAAPGSALDFDGAETTQVRYAVMENRDRLQDCLEKYRDLLKEDAEELGVEPESLQPVVQELVYRPEADPASVAEELDVPKKHAEKVQALLGTETPFEPYTVPESAVFEEEGVPLEVLDLVGWMIS